MYSIDLRTAEPRNAHEKLGGVKLLARIVDKGLAEIAGTLGSYVFFDCPLDRIFFDAVNVSRNEFLEVLRQAYTSKLSSNLVALADLREALACEPEISDQYFMTWAETSDVDNAAVSWLLYERHTASSLLDAINDSVDDLPADAFIDWIKF